MSHKRQHLLRQLGNPVVERALAERIARAYLAHGTSAGVAAALGLDEGDLAAALAASALLRAARDGAVALGRGVAPPPAPAPHRPVSPAPAPRPPPMPAAPPRPPPAPAPPAGLPPPRWRTRRRSAVGPALGQELRTLPQQSTPPDDDDEP